ncbi:MAG: TonB-dependent receptor [Bacteroidetes bacterium]|nr:TonB-dependent receptor [Bacteroidota bacterium]
MQRRYYISTFRKAFGLMLVCVCVHHNLQAQSDTASHQLKEVTVSSGREQLFGAGKKVQRFDSATQALYQSSSLADLLASQSSMHIKSYGGGNIATMSFRGGNANQTAVTWNGINIQNNMLGQNDLSLINSILFDNISLEFGGSSALWGSGAMSGTVHLDNKPVFDKGISTKLTSSFGSFDTRKLNTAIHLSYKRFVSSTKVYYISSENNYNYKDTSDKESPNKRISHADYTCKGLMQELSFLAGQRHKLSIRAWYNDTYRNLPSYTAGISKQSQTDRNLKLNAEWLYIKQRYTSVIRAAYLSDVLNYNDSLAFIYSKSNSSSVIAESENTWRLHRHVFQAGANYTLYRANTESYAGDKRYQKLAFFLSYKWSTSDQKLQTSLSIRQEFSQQYKVPLTGNIGTTYVLCKSISLKVNAAKSFRQPTLNDLYWSPGGNPDLKPEEALGYEGGIVFHKTYKHLELYAEGTFFDRYTSNWIIWLPQANNVWSPRNITKVHSRGTETNFYAKYGDSDFSVKWFGSTAYVLSTNEQSLSENDNSKGRQLIYTPRYSIQGGLLITLKDMALMYTQNYTGYRFTATDNSSWLNPYSVGNLRLSYGFSFSTIRLQTFFALNNVFNTNYQVVENRPMPLRNFEIGLSIMYHKLKK